MSKNIIILKPRLDVPFKNIGKISNKRGKILPIRKYWKQFVQIIELKHKKLGHFVKIRMNVLQPTIRVIMMPYVLIMMVAICAIATEQ